MITDVREDRTVELREVFNPVHLKTDSGEVMSICMRDSGFEFTYQGQKYSAKEGVLEVVLPKTIGPGDFTAPMSGMTDEEYIADAKSRLECNMSKEDIEVLGAFLYTEEEVDNNKEYFLKCKESGMSTYKALVFFSFHKNVAETH